MAIGLTQRVAKRVSTISNNAKSVHGTGATISNLNVRNPKIEQAKAANFNGDRLPNGNTIEVMEDNGHKIMMFDLRGLICPQPTLILTTKTYMMEEGSMLEVKADCATFDKDIVNWCGRLGKTLLHIQTKIEGGAAYKYCQIAM
jgi:TusA-related sulfurtransferase